MRHSSVVILALTAAAAGYSPEEKSWTPARQTDSFDHDVQMAQGRSPVPTESPEAVFGRMELQKRLDGYTLGPLTCGFIQANGDPLVCLSSTTDTCAYQSGYLGCCEPNKDCSRIKTRCINYSQSLAGLCTSLTDYHTVCCNSNSPACYTYTMTFSGGTGSKSGTFTGLNCSPTPGFGKLLDYDPSWSKTHSFPSSTSTSSRTSTTTSAGPTTSESTGGGGSSTNVGAIAGGTVGGVAALALVGLGVFLLLRKKKSKESDTSSPPAAMAQTQPPQQSPPQNFAGSPNVPQQGYQGYPPQAQGYNQNTQSVYDPHMSMYSQQTPYSPPQSGYPQFPQQQQQYPQQQGYNYPSNTGSYAGSPPPHTTPSPMVDGTEKGTTSPHPTSPGTVAHGEIPGQQHAPTELAVQHPVGNEHNRAELGGT